MEKILLSLFGLSGIMFFISTVYLHTNTLRKMYLINIFMYFYTLLTFPGLLIFIYQSDIGLSYILDTIIVLISSYYLFGLTFLSMKIVFKKDILVFNNISLKYNINKIYFILLISLPFSFAFFYYTGAYKAILYAFQGDILTAYYYRTEATNSMVHHGFLYTLTFKYIYPVIGAVSYAKYLQLKESKYFNIFIFSTLLVLIFNILTLQKYYLVQYLFMLILVYSIIKNKIQIKFFLKIFIFIFIFIILLVSFYVSQDAINIGEIIKNVLNRIFTDNIIGLSRYIDAYKQNFELLYGTSFSNPMHILNYDPFPLSKWIYSNYVASEAQINAGVTGSAPTNYIGEVVLNFGYIGFVIITILIGILITILNSLTKHIIQAKYKNPISVILVVFVAINIANISNGVVGTAFSYLTILSIQNWVIIITILLVSTISVKRRQINEFRIS